MTQRSWSLPCPDLAVLHDLQGKICDEAGDLVRNRAAFRLVGIQNHRKVQPFNVALLGRAGPGFCNL